MANPRIGRGSSIWGGHKHKPGTSFNSNRHTSSGSSSSSSRGSSGGSGYGGSSSLGSTHASRWEQRQQLEQQAANRGGGSSGGWSAAEMNEGFRPSSSSSSNTWSSSNRGSSSGSYGGYGSGSSGISGSYGSGSSSGHGTVSGPYISNDGYAYQSHTDPGKNHGGFSTAADGSHWLDDSPNKSHQSWFDKNTGGVNLGRNPALAGQTAMSHGHTVFYDQNGYAHKSSQGVSGYRPHIDPWAQSGRHDYQWTDQEALSPEDFGRLDAIKHQLWAGQLTGDQANAAANDIRKHYGYTIDKQGLVTDLPASGLAAIRREQWGLGSGPTSDEVNHLAQIYPNDIKAPGIKPGYLENYYGGYKPNYQPDYTGGGAGGYGGGYGGFPGGSISGSISGGYGGGGTPTPPPSFGSFEDWSGSGKPGEGTAPNSGADYIRQMYEQMQKEQEAQLRAMYEAQLARLNGQQAQIDKEYADRANQAAAQADVQRMQMNDMGIAQGLNTGATGQLALGQSMALQGALGGLNQAAAQDKMENARDVNELSAMYNNKLQALSSGIQSDLMNALIEEYNRQQAIWMEQQQRAREEAWRQRQWEYQQQQDAWDRQKWQYQAQQDAWNRQMAQQAADEDRRRWELNFGLKANPTEATPVRPSGGGGNPRPTNPKPKPTQNWDNKGLSSDQIRQLQSMKPGLAVDGLWGPASSAAFGDMDAKTAWDTYGGSVKPAADPNFEQFMRVVGANIAQGNTKLAQQMIEQNWGRMTPEQQKRVNDFRASFN